MPLHLLVNQMISPGESSDLDLKAQNRAGFQQNIAQPSAHFLALRFLISWQHQHCFYFLMFFGCAVRHAGSQFLDQESNPYPLHWEYSLNHWVTREAPSLLFIYCYYFSCGSFLKSLLNQLQPCFCFLCFGFLAARHMGSYLSDQELNTYPCAGRWSINQWTPRGVQAF